MVDNHAAVSLLGLYSFTSILSVPPHSSAPPNYAKVVAQIPLVDETSTTLLLFLTGVVVVGLYFTSQHRAWLNNGYLVAIYCAWAAVLMNNLVREAQHSYRLPFGGCVIARAICISIGSITLAKCRAEPVRIIPTSGRVMLKIVFRGACGVTSVFMFFVAFQYADVLRCLVVYYSNSIFSAIFGSFFLRDYLSHDELASMLVGIVAVVVIVSTTIGGGVDQPATSTTLVGLMFAFVAAIAEAVGGVTGRGLKDEAHPLALMVIQAVFGTGVCFALMAVWPDFFIVWPLEAVQVRVLIGIVVTSFMVQLTVNQAYMLEKTGPIQVFINAMILVPQVALDMAFGRTYELATWAGIGLLMMYLVLSWHNLRKKAFVEETQALLESKIKASPKPSGCPEP